MKSKTALTLAIVAGASLAALAGAPAWMGAGPLGASALPWRTAVAQSDTVAESQRSKTMREGAILAHFSGRRHGWRRGHASGHRDLCAGVRGRGVEDAIQLVEGIMDFTPEQAGAWQSLADALRSGGVKLDRACGDPGPGAEATAPRTLAGLEAMLAAGLEAVRGARPAFEGFYAALSDKQRRAIDDFVSRRRH